MVSWALMLCICNKVRIYGMWINYDDDDDNELSRGPLWHLVEIVRSTSGLKSKASMKSATSGWQTDQSQIMNRFHSGCLQMEVMHASAIVGCVALQFRSNSSQSLLWDSKCLILPDSTLFCKYSSGLHVDKLSRIFPWKDLCPVSNLIPSKCEAAMSLLSHPGQDPNFGFCSSNKEYKKYSFWMYYTSISSYHQPPKKSWILRFSTAEKL
jgi:hypothetical protein